MSALARAYRRTGADLPFGDQGEPHGVAMEGYYQRYVLGDRVVVVLRGACPGWDLVAVATHPGGGVRWAIVSPGGYPDGVSVDVAIDPVLPWPRRAFGALGPAQCVPWLGQYWHPQVLLGTARGSITLGAEQIDLDGAHAYAEKNWGSRFAGHWWWGQAHLDFGAVCFAGGRMLGGAPTALVVAVGSEVLRLSPPLSRMNVATAPGVWRIRARGPRHSVELEADADPAGAHVLPVPVPAERRAIMRSRQHLTGHLSVVVRRGNRVVARGETDRAGLERGTP